MYFGVHFNEIFFLFSTSSSSSSSSWMRCCSLAVNVCFAYTFRFQTSLLIDNWRDPTEKLTKNKQTRTLCLFWFRTKEKTKPSNGTAIHECNSEYKHSLKYCTNRRRRKRLCSTKWSTNCVCFGQRMWKRRTNEHILNEFKIKCYILLRREQARARLVLKMRDRGKEGEIRNRYSLDLSELKKRAHRNV